MNIRKKALFLADCLSHMPDQPEHVQSFVDTVISGLNRIASGGEWSMDEAWAACAWVGAASKAASYAARAARTSARAADWETSAALADYEASRAASYAARAARTADYEAYRAADYAASAHPDPTAERARQKVKREELGL